MQRGVWIPLEHVQGCGIRFELISCVTFPRCYDFTSKRFKTRSEQESEKAVREAKIGNEWKTVVKRMLRVQPWIIILGITCNTAFQKLSFKTVSSSRFCGTFNLVLKRPQSKSGICYLQNAKLDLIFQEMLPFVRCVEIGVNLVAVT